MTKIDKLLKKLRESPKNIRFEELESVLLSLGFTLRNVRGSHYYYKKGSELILVVKPHGKRKFCAPQDVKDVLRYLEKEKENE